LVITDRQSSAKQKGAIRVPKIDTQITPVKHTALCSIQNAKGSVSYSIVDTQNCLSLLYHRITSFFVNFVAQIMDLKQNLRFGEKLPCELVKRWSMTPFSTSIIQF